MKRNTRTATDVDVYVGAQLKILRKSAKLSQTDLAEQIGVTFQQVQKYERGTNRIGASRLWSLCQVFDIKPDRFFEGLDEHLAQTKNETRDDDKSENGGTATPLRQSEGASLQKVA